MPLPFASNDAEDFSLFDGKIDIFQRPYELTAGVLTAIRTKTYRSSFKGIVQRIDYVEFSPQIGAFNWSNSALSLAMRSRSRYS